MTPSLEKILDELGIDTLQHIKDAAAERIADKQAEPAPQKREPQPGEVWRCRKLGTIFWMLPVYVDDEGKWSAISIEGTNHPTLSSNDSMMKRGEYLAPSLAAYFEEQFRRELPEGFVRELTVRTACALCFEACAEGWGERSIARGRFDEEIKEFLSSGKRPFHSWRVTDDVFNRAVKLDREERENA